MKKLIVYSFIFSLFIFGAYAQEIKTEQMKDVPADHWAAEAVYDLIKLGITKGYPDGTFRGNKPITRYETALFLSKMAKALDTENHSEITALRDQLQEAKQTGVGGVPITGSYDGSWKAGNLLSTQGASRGTVGSYRLVVSSSQEVGDNASLKVNLDTMDFGYFDDGSPASSGRGQLAAGLLDIESRLKLNLSENPVELKVTYGSGPKEHSGDPTGVLPSEVGVVYERPNTGVQASTSLPLADFSIGYYALQGANFNTSGKLDASQLTGSMAFNLPSLFNSVRVILTGDYITKGLNSSSDKDLRAKLDLSLPLGEKVQASTVVGMADRSNSGMMVSGSLSLNDLWDTGTFATIRLAKIGSSYIDPRFANEEFYFAGYDYFNRPLVPGTVQVGGTLTQVVSDKVKLVGRGDVRLAGNYKYEGDKARLTAEGGISYNLAPHAELDAAYRVHQDKGTSDTSDMAALGLMYKF
jgi:hypothetical protein